MDVDIESLVLRIMSTESSLSRTEVESIVRDIVSANVQSPFVAETVSQNAEAIEAAASVEESAAGETSNSDERGHYPYYPESFRCVQDPVTNVYSIINPIVCTPSGKIMATGADNLSTGNYYCKVSNENGTFSAEITDSTETDDNTIVIVPIADITENDGIHQKHIGTIIVAGSGKEYVAGSDTNIVFSEVASGENKGRIKIDVYYK